MFATGKRIAQLIAWTGFIGMTLHGQSQSWCVPQTGQEQDSLSGCGSDPDLWTNIKTVRWPVSWPDGANSTQGNTGYGACRANVGCSFADRVDCWALFDTPVGSPNYWSQTVTDRQADWAQGDHTCPPPYNNSVGQNISCNGTGVIRTAVRITPVLSRSVRAVSGAW